MKRKKKKIKIILPVCPFCEETPKVVINGVWNKVSCHNPRCKINPETKWSRDIRTCISNWSGRGPNFDSKQMVKFHGGCIGCKRQFIEPEGVEFCRKCQYFEADWDLPDLSLRNPTFVDSICSAIKHKFGMPERVY